MPTAQPPQPENQYEIIEKELYAPEIEESIKQQEFLKRISDDLKTPDKRMIDSFIDIQNEIKTLTPEDQEKARKEIDDLIKKLISEQLKEAQLETPDQIKQAINEAANEIRAIIEEQPENAAESTSRGETLNAEKLKAQKFIEKPSFEALMDNLDLIEDENIKRQILLINILRTEARKKQEEFGERWEYVEEIDGKYCWVIDKETAKADRQRGFRREAAYGNHLEKKKLTSSKIELTVDEENAYKQWIEAREGNKEIFEKVLDDIANFEFDRKKSLPEQAEEFWKKLSAEQKQTFAAREKLLTQDNKPKEEECKIKIRAYINSVFGARGKYEFIENEYISDAEKKNIIDNIDEVETILEELAKDEAGVPPVSGVESGTESAAETAERTAEQVSLYEMAKKLLDVVMKNGGETPEEKLLYLKYQHLRGLRGREVHKTNIRMVYFLQYIIKQHENGQTANLKMTEKGWEVNSEEKWKPVEHPKEFEKDLITYKEVLQFLKTNEETKNLTSGELRRMLKKICENYMDYQDNPETHKNKPEYKMLKSIKEHFKDNIADLLQYIYKALIFFEQTEIKLNKVKFTEVEVSQKVKGTPDIAEEDLNIFRKHYADRRRTLRKFLDRISKSPGAQMTDLEEARSRYTNAYRTRITHNVTADDTLNNMAFNTDADKAVYKTAVRNKVVGELLDERRKLLSTEVELQRGSAWEKLKTFWRKHPIWRLGISGALLGSTIAFLGTPLAIPFILAKAGWLGMNTQIAWEGGWETIQQKFGATRSRFGINVPAMDENEARRRLAAHTTLSTGRLPGYTAPPNVAQASLQQFYGGGAGEQIWNRYKEHIDAKIDAALGALGQQATKEQIVLAAIQTGLDEEAKFMQEVEARERYIRKTDIIKKVSGLAFGLAVAGYSLFADLAHLKETAVVKEAAEAKAAVASAASHPAAPTGPVDTGADDVFGGSTEAGNPLPSEPMPVEPVAPVTPVTPEPITPEPVPVEPSPVPVEPVAPVTPDVIPPHGDITFKMIDSMPGDPDPGVYQAMPYKLEMNASQATELREYMLHRHTLSGMEKLNLFLDRPGIIDSHGAFQSGINFVKPGEEFIIPDAGSFVDKIFNIMGGSVPKNEIIRRLAS
ncbi:hypothetical protein HZA39_04580 [Candidatus Peregrinibacteria bacterium]|nr:hypothetical protein [Candidatus Peregrinibacteria bacterium]